MSSAVTLNLVLSIRKVVSLVLSILAFRNPITSGHVWGIALVTVGTLLYSVPPKGERKEEKEKTQ